MSSAPVDSVGSHPPVSIIGIGCRLPGAASVAEFWQLLVESRDATSTPPTGRLGSRRGGYIDDVESFDNDWFAISDREAAVMDPQQRLALEVAVEALDDAGIGYRARGCGAAVVFGASGYDHGIAVLGRAGHDAPYAVTGSALSIIANRLSYVLDLHGPSLVLDSACSSSLAAVDLAVRLLADGTVPFAIVGGVNLVLLEHTSDYLAEGGFLSPGGRSTPFDVTADGYTRGDGCAVVILQRSADAVREGNRVYAEIVGTAVGSDGRSNGLYAPNGRAQQETLRNAWSRAGYAPSSAGYIECHGTGTPLGDAVEVGALAAALGDGADDPVWIGSVKSNIGHLEAAAGVTGMVKTALSIHHGVIAPTINVHTEHPLLHLAERGLRVPTEPVDWSPVPAPRRVAGVSSFGFGGTIAHIVLRGVTSARSERGEHFPVLLPLTARDDEELRERALRLADAVDEAGPSSRALVSATARLLPEPVRAAVLAHDHGDALHRLRALGRGDAEAALGPVAQRRRGGLLFLFSGQGGQHPKMGRALAARYPVFAAALAETTDAIVAAGGPRIWTPRHGFTSAGDAQATDLVQPALFAFQVALVKLLAAWGIRPDAVAGHSLGEIAAAAVSGALSLADAARVVVLRSATLAHLDGHGAMAVLEAAPDEAAKLVEPMRAEVAVAAVNGPRSVVVSGTPRYVDTLVRRATRRNMFARRLAVAFAAHSPQVATVLPPFVAALTEITPLAPRVPVYSTVRRGAKLTTAATDREYWARNAADTVELAAAMERAAEDGIATVVEIGPHPVLLSAVREYPDFRDGTHAVALRDDEASGFLTGLARLYLEGRPVDWSALGPFGTPTPRKWRKRKFPLLVAGPASAHIPESAFAAEELSQHVVQGESTVPAVFWLRRLLHLARDTAGAATLADFAVHERTDPAVLPEVVYRGPGAEESMRAEVTGTGTLASARPAGDPTPADIVAWMRVVDANRAARHHMRVITIGAFYQELRRRRLEYGPRFRALRGIAAGTGRALGLFDAAELHRTATLDGCLHVLAAAVFDELPTTSIPLPIGMDSAWLSHEPNRHVLEVHALIRERSDTGLVGDVIATDQHGVPCLAFSGVHIRYADPGAEENLGAVRATRAEHDAHFRQEAWAARDPETLGLGGASVDQTPVRRAVVVGASDLAVRLARALDAEVPTERIAREPDDARPLVGAVLTGRGGGHAVAVVWPADSAVGEGNSGAPATGRVLELLQLISAHDAPTSVTVVLPQEQAARAHSRPTEACLPTSVEAAAIAGLVRTLQLETGRTVRLIWTDADPRNVPLLTSLVTATDSAIPDELRLSAGEIAVRRFTPARARALPVAAVDANGTYVVTGGLGTLGSVAVRWLLDAGARDVVVLTRAPRPVPALLDGLEDRIVVVRCDAADRDDLANALSDIRASDSAIRGVVHAAGALEDAAFDAVTAGQLARMFLPKPTAAANLIELTATDATDFVLLFSSATGALGAPGQAAYAAANAAMDALAQRDPGRRILSIGWGLWDSGLAAAAGGASHLRRAGIGAFDLRRGSTVLAQALRYDGPYLLALEHTPTADTSPVALRLANLLVPMLDPSPAPTRNTAPAPPERAEPLTTIIRRVLASTLDLPAEHIDPAADFNDLGLSSLLAIEMRRNLEARLRVRIATAELFKHPTITALGAALLDRVANTEETS
ncbi:SDR family NAD(P)-dependent oxidoreductase [Nocardia abscessus]|uniref:SDR family NAD(P)-dependent oxidoreductase n=1 Tax=Nocardia abscessus TaxID=120957 RepID=A0ABS0C295_9NOCA|nr:type I polyketide synthase [Nocardia abscessus]MBF6223578.1 SDR family NAD(P)-dependent oxidoreductase [Nocardia abscessus]